MNHTNRFHEWTAIVTGASSGIGKATAMALAREGARVALIARRENLLSEVAEAIRGQGGEAVSIAADLMDGNARAQAVARAVDALGGVDLLVNAAGVIRFGTLENTALDAWQDMFELNVAAVFHMMQLALPHLRKRPGSVVNVSSVTGIRSFPGVLSYCASKAALDQLTRCAALELAAEGVRVNAVNPGVVVSELHRAGGLDEQRYQAFLDHSRTTHPMGRVGQAEEIASLILFLAGPESGWITGTTMPIDGGRHLTCAR